MLIIHNDLDFRVPVSEGRQLFTTLQRLGVPSKFINFPDEGHWVLKPANSAFWHREVFAWLKKYCAAGGGKPIKRQPHDSIVGIRSDQTAKSRQGRQNILFLLVPKLCLGTHFLEALLRVRRVAIKPGSHHRAKQSLAEGRSQAELGNERGSEANSGWKILWTSCPIPVPAIRPRVTARNWVRPTEV